MKDVLADCNQILNFESKWNACKKVCFYYSTLLMIKMRNFENHVHYKNLI